MINKRVLFVLKRREDFNPVLHSKNGLSTGLYNSASMMVDMLTELNIQSKISVVIDNSYIADEIQKYNPTHVIIEALWVVPSKFIELTKEYPAVKWIIRLHSDMPFLANEGIAIDWIGDYLTFKNITIACNSPRLTHELKVLANSINSYYDERVIYLPNYFSSDFLNKQLTYDSNEIHISCFGAVRPMKNHLIQAFAAIEFCNIVKKDLVFHINAGRTEMKGQPVINNLVGLFSHLSNTNHTLYQHDWMPRNEFLKLCATMDIGLQVSLSETFNIVGADLVSRGIPVITSAEIPWIDKRFTANPTDSRSIVSALIDTYYNPNINIRNNKENLIKYLGLTKEIWNTYFIKN